MCIRHYFGTLAGVGGEDHKTAILHGNRRETIITYAV